MKNMIVEIDKNEVKTRARDYFIEICGLYNRERLKPRQIDEALDSLEDIFPNIKIKAVLSEYGSDSVRGSELVCDGITFQCQALSQAPLMDVLGVYIYLLTVGNVNIECKRVLYEVYYDAWLTAFVDAGRDLLKEFISNSQTYSDFAVSDSFGPGFFGMPATDTYKFVQILEADKIGVRVKPNGLLLPVKSYAGFFLITTQEESLPSKDCESCLSRGRTCSYCKTGRRRKPAAELELMKGDLFKGRHWQTSV